MAKIREFRRRLVSLIAMLPWIPGLAASGPRRPAFIVPFAVQRQGSRFATELEVTEAKTYTLTLRLGFKENDPADRKRVRALAGGGGRDKNGNLLEPGLEIPVRLTIVGIKPSAEKPLLEKTYLVKEQQGFTASSFSQLIDQVHMQPGIYRMSVESVQDIPELEGVPVSFAIGPSRR